MNATQDKSSVAIKTDTRERLTFINYTPESFEGPWLDHQPVMSRLAKKHTVIYVSADRTMDQLRRAIRNSTRLRSIVRVMAPHIFEMTPSSLLPRMFGFRRLNSALDYLRNRVVHRTAENLNHGARKVLYFWDPSFCGLVGHMKEDLSVFHIHDYYPAFFTKGTREFTRTMDDFKKAIESSDLVIACSQALLEEVHALGRKDAKLVENGVDYETVAHGVGAPVPPEFANLPRPIVGHIGRINRKVNLEAIARMARERPHWSLVLMGPRTGWGPAYERRFQEILALGNVHYVAGRGWTELPPYFNALDVGLMAYHTEGTWMSFGSPLKVWEYFSLGKAVVASDIQALRGYPGLLHLVGTEGDWVHAVQAALDGDTADLHEERKKLARQHDWDSRTELIESLIFDALAAKLAS